VPRKKKPVRVTSGLRRMQSQARTLLAKLREEIRDKEAQLKRLKEHQSGLGRLAGGGRAPAPAARRGGGGGGRVNWRSVLEQLPKQFSAADVRAVRGLNNKRPSEIFAAITRWIEAGLAKRKSRGAYEKS
jgi:SMC interacting uncharacterized protein involved in chromosome segregation